MKTKIESNTHIWIMLGLGLIIRLAIYFATAGNRDANAIDAIVIVCDLAIGYVLFILAAQVFGSQESPAPAEGDDCETETPTQRGWPHAIAALWIFNPVTIYISSGLGLLEPLLVLLVLLVLVLFRDKIYSVAMVLFFPVAFQLRAWFGSPDYGSIGGFNFFALIGGYERPIDTFFLGFVYYVWGAVFILAIVAGAALVLFTDYQKGGKNYFLIIGTYFVLLFVFSTGMDAHGLFPGLVFLLLHFIERRDGRVLGLYLAFSVTLLINAYQLAGVGSYGFWFSRDFLFFSSTVNVILSLVLAVILINTVWPNFKLLAPTGQKREGIPPRYYIWIMLAAGFLVRVIAVVHIDYAFNFDVNVFRMWGELIHEHGFRAYYYNHPHIPMTDYPPVYLYVLYLITALRSFFDWDQHSVIANFTLFLPAILCDLGIGYVLQRRAEKTQRPYSRPHIPALLAAFWMFNPAIILISSVWGQVESVFVLLLLLSLLLLRDKKLLPAYLIYGIAILTKPQSLFLAPVYLFSALEYLQEHKFAKFNIMQLGCYILMAAALMLLIFVPFDLVRALRFFMDGLETRPYATINAFNFYGLIGANWRPLNYRFMGIPYSIIGMVTIFVIIGGTLAALHVDRKRGGHNYFLIVGGLLAVLYIFSFRMLDRYLFPAIPILLLHAIEKRDRRVLGLYVGLSVTFFFNCFEILRWVRHGEIRYDVVRAVSAGNVLLGVFLLFIVVSCVWGGAREAGQTERLEIKADPAYTRNTHD
ncbi:MAG: glycosyltransferase 87 family protein [Defluviitaleaceae bacterium]|nr:glycosyltransferase 87 family protein [Defluviitaleaceae bacterium]